MTYERVFKKKKIHYIPLLEVDLVRDAVWEPGQGDRIREQDREESKNKKSSTKTALSKVLTLKF